MRRRGQMKSLRRDVASVKKNGAYVRGDKRAIDLEHTTRATLARLEHHTKIFASMCPDEILDHYDDYETRVYYTTLMLGDVSGFTDLAEKYTKTGKGGPSKLTETLNSYIGAMVQEILSHNGDVLKFSGDAFIVMWKLEDGKVMRDLAVEAMQTACVIQKHFGSYNTDVGVTLKVKLAIASGKTYFTSIGDPKNMSYYIITGKPVWDVKFAEGLCRGGDILVAPSSWQWVNPNEYVYEALPDGIHTLIVACSSTWYQSKGDDSPSSTDEDDINGYRSGGSIGSASISRILSGTDLGKPTLTTATFDEDIFENVDYTLRPKVIKISKARLKDVLRSYMLRPVVRSVEMDEPLEFLTEMRQVVILFVNVITSNVGKKTLITLVKKAYKLVCRIVGTMHGCVNKTSLFDKDLIFLCVFGLRGDKHELESQIGLRCASKVRKSLTALKNVKSVTIGVTTGVTYCGVVGHILRREYTVIGMSVNKAARLMVAYKNKVICDRESFLHSHLEARHFILQEPKHLKGITNVGPVYEFQEYVKQTVSDVVWNKYPLLGRENEIKIFRESLASLGENINVNKRKRGQRPEYNTLIIKGEPRIGKTRLLDEITQNIPLGIPCNYVVLISEDTKTPYTLIHLIFSMALGFSVTSSRKERENKLLSRLGKIRQTHFLCALNQPFRVRFAMSYRYKALSKMEKWKVLRKFLLKLMRACFHELWVVIIDDIEYGDEESLQLFDTLTKRDSVLYVISGGRKLGAEYKLHPPLLKRAKIIELAGIDKWYHAGLACQVLNVRGIPAELEKLIQEKSFGNPGWIESYLVSLEQSGGFTMLHITIKEADTMGYVMPNVAMLQRRAPEAVGLNIESIKQRADRWQMYRTSFKDSAISLLEAQQNMTKSSMHMDNDYKRIAVCKIAENFSMAELDTEVTMDVMILKLFDSLTPLDQHLIKCASVLGETVNRHMLEHLMNATSDREVALSVLKLFEIRIFGCAFGEFGGNKNPVIYFRSMRNPSSETNVLCRCTGLVIPKEVEDLPKYASCGLMRFKTSMFRVTTYRLLTENRKMELHNQALKYLQQYTRRCVACGGGRFAKLLGKLSAQEDRKKRLTDIDEILEYVQLESESSAGKTDRDKGQKPFLSCVNVFKKIEKKPTITFSNVDFTNCQCHLILMTVYTQILDHCRGIGRTDLTLTATLEFVEICIKSYNIPQARRLLIDCEGILQEMFKSSEDELVVLPYLTGKIQTLEGKCYLESGLISEAETVLEQALDNLGYKFPRREIIIDLKTMVQLEQLRLKLVCFQNWKNESIKEEAQNYMEQLAHCLSQMFELFRTKGMKKHARLAAIWSLNEALNSSENFFILCTCFTNMLITAHIYQNRTIIPYLENEGINICSGETDTLEIHELKTIAELYAGIFFSRWVRGQITKAIQIGFICIRMANTLGSTFLWLLILPRLTHLLMISCRHSEMVTQLRELEFVSHNDLDKSGRTWYYALCVDVQLDTGLTVLSFAKCEQYFLREGDTMISLRDPEAEKRYFTSMWLWCVRTEQWEASKLWSKINISSEPVMDEHTVAASITELKKLEGLLILYGTGLDYTRMRSSLLVTEIAFYLNQTLIHKLNTRDVNAIITMSNIKDTFKTVDKMMKTVKIAVPRYMLLRAYYHMIKSQKNAASKLLRRTKTLCLKVGNRMIYTWALHCEMAWSGAISSVQEDMWKDVSINSIQTEWDEVNANDAKMVPFTFPLPKYTY